MIARLFYIARARWSGNTLSGPVYQAKIRIKGAQNTLEIGTENSPRSLSRLLIKIRGRGNRVVIGNGLRLQGVLSLAIEGNDCEIIIDDGLVVVEHLSVLMLKKCQGGRISIGMGTTFWRGEIRNYDSGSSVTIGKDCMFSYDTSVLNTDEHAILVDGKVANRAGLLEIGDHVWVGWHAAVMKNSRVSSGSIVARSALVSGRHDEPQTVLAGVPARIVKHGVNWSRRDVNELVEI